jgi:hypothetical protein
MSAPRTTTITNILQNPGTGKPIVGKTVSIRLNVPGFVNGGSTEKRRSTYATTDATGEWSAVLEVNADIDPAGTYYTVSELGTIWPFVVPFSASALTLRACLVTDPANPDPLTAGVALPVNQTPGDVATVAADGNSVEWDTATGGVQSVVAGTGVTVDDTDPANPVVSSTATGGVSSFNTRTGAVSLTKGDVTATGLAASDVGADASGAASAAQSAAVAAAATDATTKASAAQAAAIAASDTAGAAASAQAFAIQRGNHTGTQSADTLTDGTTNKAFLATERTKLAAITGTNTGDQDLSALAPKASPALTGTPTAPTAAAGTNTTQLATTANVVAQIAAEAVRYDAAQSLTSPQKTQAQLNMGVGALSTGLNAFTGMFHATGYGAKADVKTVSDAGMTSGSANLTSATAAFVAGDVGKLVVVCNAKGAGVHLYGTISSLTSGTVVVLSASATATVANTVATYGTDDTTAIQNCINDAVATNGVVALPSTPMAISAALSITGSVTIQGGGWTEIHGSASQGVHSLEVPVAAPYLTGSVLTVMTASTNAVNLTGAGATPRMFRFAVRFAGSFKTTGHGFFYQPPVNGAGGRDHGLICSTWRELGVFGHDGDHYAWYLINPIASLFDQLRSVGGGVLKFENNGAGGNYGNCTVTHLCAMFICNGTALGVHLASTINTMNLLSFNGVYIGSGDYSAVYSGYGLTAASGTIWDDASARNIVVNQLDLEGTAHTNFGNNPRWISPGSYTPISTTGNPFFGDRPDATFDVTGAATPSIISDGSIINPRTDTVSTRRSPYVAKVGGQGFAAETNRPVWSDGSDWRYADGTVANVAGTPGGAGTIPSSISTGPIGWWSADTITGSPADGTAIASWNDQAGTPHALAQATGSKQPKIKTGVLNSKAAVRFDGVDDYLATSAFSQAQPLTATIVYKYVGLGSRISGNGYILTGGMLMVGQKDSSATQTLWSFGSAEMDYVAAVNADKWGIVTVQMNGASSLFRLNGTQVATGNTGSTGLSLVSVGGDTTGNLTRIDVAEIVVFGSALSGANMLEVERWLATKYALTSA